MLLLPPVLGMKCSESLCVCACACVHCLCSLPQCCYHLYVNAACCKWQISNRLHVRSVSRCGSAWRRVMQRHSPSRYSSGLREAQLYCDTGSGHTDCDRQTDTKYIMLTMLYLFAMLFSTNFGLRMATTWTLIRTAEDCCFSACVRNVLFCSLRLSVQFTVCDPAAGSERLPAVCICKSAADTLQTLDADRLSVTQCLHAHLCAQTPNATPLRRIAYCVLRTACSDNFTADAPIKSVRAFTRWRVASEHIAHGQRFAWLSSATPGNCLWCWHCLTSCFNRFLSHSFHCWAANLLPVSASLGKCRTVPNTGTAMSIDGSESVVQGQ